MKTLEELIDLRTAVYEEAGAVLDKAEEEKRDLSDEESKTVGDLHDKMDKLDVKVKQAERIEDRKTFMTEPVPTRTVGEIKAGLNEPIDDDTSRGEHRDSQKVPEFRIPARAVRNTKLTRNFPGENAHEKAKTTYRCGMWIQAAMQEDPKAIAFCESQGIPCDPKSWRHYTDHGESRVMQSTSQFAGGATIFDEFSSAIIDYAEEFGVFRQNAEVVPMGSETMSWPRVTGGNTAYFVAENTAPTESNPTFDNVMLTARELATLTLIPRTLGEDSAIAIAELVARKSGLAMATKEDTVGFNGTGISTDGGIEGITVKIDDGNHTASVIGAIASNDSFETLDVDDFAKCIGSLPRFPGLRPKWYISQAGWGASMLRLMDAAGGNTMRNLSDGISQAQFLGFDIVISQSLNTTLGTDASAIKALFGDLSWSSFFGDRRSVTIETNSGGKFFEQRQIAVLGSERFDIVNHSLGDNTDAGPIVALKTSS